MLSNVTGSPVRSCKVPEVMIVSPMFRPCNTCTSASVRMPVVISTGCAFPEFIKENLILAHFRNDGLGGYGKCVLYFVLIQLDTGITARQYGAVGIGIERTDSQCMGRGVYL